jgi:hypothetical protein
MWVQHYEVPRILAGGKLLRNTDRNTWTYGMAGFIARQNRQTSSYIDKP